MNTDERKAQMRKEIEAKVGFYKHCGIYVLVNALLVAKNLMDGHGHLWAFWPLAGWGIGLLSHGLGVFVLSGWTERWIQRELAKNKID